MNQKIYLDNNATTKIDDEVFSAMLPYFKEQYGNPSSAYSFGKNIKKEINNARKNVAELINADSDEIVFTSCGSESNVTAIMSSISVDESKKHIITTSIEHASIMETMDKLQQRGYDITYLKVDKSGNINLEELEAAIRKDTCLISIMMANNEIGNIYPIKNISEIAHRHNILVHCDAVQAIGKTPVNVKEIDVDMLSFSGHKINGPKGIGVLYTKKGIPFTPLIFGHQEANRRGGTENVPYIIGLGKAAEIIIKDNYNKEGEIKTLRDYMENKIKTSIDDVLIYGDVNNRTPNTSSIAFKGVKADELMLLLESFNIYVSTGSACNSEIALPSHVLTACGADLEDYSPIRISLGKYNTKDEIDEFIKRLINIISMVRRRS